MDGAVGAAHRCPSPQSSCRLPHGPSTSFSLVQSSLYEDNHPSPLEQRPLHTHHTHISLRMSLSSEPSMLSPSPPAFLSSLSSGERPLRSSSSPVDFPSSPSPTSYQEILSIPRSRGGVLIRPQRSGGHMRMHSSPSISPVSSQSVRQDGRLVLAVRKQTADSDRQASWNWAEAQNCARLCGNIRAGKNYGTVRHRLRSVPLARLPAGKVPAMRTVSASESASASMSASGSPTGDDVSTESSSFSTTGSDLGSSRRSSCAAQELRQPVPTDCADAAASVSAAPALGSHSLRRCPELSSQEMARVRSEKAPGEPFYQPPVVSATEGNRLLAKNLNRPTSRRCGLSMAAVRKSHSVPNMLCL